MATLTNNHNVTSHTKKDKGSCLASPFLMRVVHAIVHGKQEAMNFY